MTVHVAINVKSFDPRFGKPWLAVVKDWVKGDPPKLYFEPCSWTGHALTGGKLEIDVRTGEYLCWGQPGRTFGLSADGDHDRKCEWMYVTSKGVVRSVDPKDVMESFYALDYDEGFGDPVPFIRASRPPKKLYAEAYVDELDDEL